MITAHHLEAAMTDSDHSLVAIVAAIEADGRWGVWESDTGWWWAARTGALTASEIAAGCVPFVHAHNLKELSERAQEQDRLSRGQGGTSKTLGITDSK